MTHRGLAPRQRLPGQSKAQAPGPPGWPQLPQDPIEGIAAGAPASDPAVANTDSFFSSDTLWHLGHSGASPARTSFSNSVAQSEQRYSNMGMVREF